MDAITLGQMQELTHQWHDWIAFSYQQNGMLYSQILCKNLFQTPPLIIVQYCTQHIQILEFQGFLDLRIVG
jgi:hypothetical protein